ITIKEVIIHRLHDGVFYSVVVCELDGHTEEIDARTSDAIALAIRFKSPIYTYESIMKEAGIVFSETEGEAPSPAEEAVPSASQNPIKKNRPKGDLTQFSNVELDAMLTEALENEDYVFAAKIRDEMHKREEGI
ncbi:MAG: bifunctional nuclease family protein, partial [Bacteroidetes bacterium]|nr:bifunctional nuclease family protein [Bacteroidota bacterium]